MLGFVLCLVKGRVWWTWQCLQWNEGREWNCCPTKDTVVKNSWAFMALWLLRFMYAAFSFSVQRFCNGVMDVKVTLWEDNFLPLSCLSIAGASSSPLVTWPFAPAVSINCCHMVTAGKRGPFSSPEPANYRQAAKKRSVDILSHIMHSKSILL